jgi:PfaD family protein
MSLIENQYGKIGDFSSTYTIYRSKDGKYSLVGTGESVTTDSTLVGVLPSYSEEMLGDPLFKQNYKTKYAYMAGAMAGGISSVELVIALGKAGCLCSFGAGGLPMNKVQEAIDQIKNALPDGPFAINLIHNPLNKVVEEKTVDLFLKNNITVIEASAYINITPHLVYYRLAGLSQNADGSINIKNRVIAKISRREIAKRFLEPAPQKYIKELLASGKITEEQARLGVLVPLADDVTVEADSAGHTDNRPLVVMLPSIIDYRNELQEKYKFETPVRIGAGGGISTPEAALAAFSMGAAYIVTGSVNQCVESGTSDFVRKVLSQCEATDVMMAPASDMFEMGVRLQVLKRGTMFAMRAQKLYDLYYKYNTIEEIPEQDRLTIEKEIFQKTLDSVWDETVAFFRIRDPHQIEKAEKNPKRKMALIFRWYLGLASRWAKIGEPGREQDYQIWCGPAMGGFNNWVKGTYLENYENRHAVAIAQEILKGTVYLTRVNILRHVGCNLPLQYQRYKPEAVCQPA